MKLDKNYDHWVCLHNIGGCYKQDFIKSIDLENKLLITDPHNTIIQLKNVIAIDQVKIGEYNGYI